MRFLHQCGGSVCDFVVSVSGALDSDLLARTEGAGSIVAIVEASVSEWANEHLGSLAAIETVPVGKTIDHVQLIWKALFDWDASMMIAVGGGTILDAAGFAASTYRRGIRYWAVPTTLVAMVDSALGGLSGIDFAHRRNVVGASHLPEVAFCPVPLLRSIEPSRRYLGMAEVLKLACTHDQFLFEAVADPPRQISDEWLAREVVIPAAQLKDRVCRDPSASEFGLLFGHNVSYALETLFGFDHASAVSIGCVAEARIAWRCGALDHEELRRVVAAFRSWNLPITTTSVIDSTEFYEVMMAYKMTGSSQAKFCVPSSIGTRHGGLHGLLTVPRPELIDLLDTIFVENV